MEVFKRTVIYPQIIKSEYENQRFTEWIKMTKLNEYDVEAMEKKG